MDFIKVQWFCCNFILQLHFLYIYIYIYIFIYISGDTCVCLAELFWSLIHKMQYFEMYMIKWSQFLEGMMVWVTP